MDIRNTRSGLFIAPVTALVTVPALAMSITSAHADWGIDLGLVNQQSQYKDSSSKPDVVLGSTYRLNNSGDQLSNPVSYEFVLSQNNIGYKASDGKVFSGMEKRKGSIDLGARATIDAGFVPVTVEATKDVRAAKGFGAMVKIGGISSASDSGLTVRPTAGIRYQNSKTTNYYYGVHSSEATASRNKYQTGSATTPFLGVEAIMNLSPNVSLNADVTYEKRPKSVKNSPLTDDEKYDPQAKIGMTYWF